MATIIEQEEIDSLRANIASLRLELSNKEAILAFLESKKLKENTEEIGETQASIFDVDNLILPSTGSKTIFDEVKDVVKRFGDQEFTVSHVFAALAQLKVINQETKSAKPRIASILSDLYKSNELNRTFAGKGNVPHRYKNIKKGDELNN